MPQLPSLRSTEDPEWRKQLAWRQHAVELAAARKLIGQAQYIKETTSGVYLWQCVSVHEPVDHAILYDVASGKAMCDCLAGERDQPCSHAGAVLLAMNGLAPQRSRSAEGA